MNTLIGTESSDTFGGVINIEDFNTSIPNKKRIKNQIDANTLISSSLEKKQKKEQEKKYKNMTLEELKEMKIISNTNGRPSSSLTNEKWQKEFNVRKYFVKPISRDIKKLSGKFSKESGMWNEEIQGTYNGTTNWQEYCSYINDILKNIRSNQVDYCYYIYQIMILLKFHPNTLKTEYCDGYWKIWLEREGNKIYG